METPILSFVLPAYNEEMNVGPVTERLIAIGEQLGRPFEIVWVNDGSRDRTAEHLDALAAKEPRVRLVHLSRNFGHMSALTAGMECARGTGAVVCLDADGQHPPELIPEMVARWESGVDIVQTVRNYGPQGTAMKKLTSRAFYKVMDYLSDVDLPEGAADFRLMDRQVVDALNNLPERVRFVRGLVHWVGFNRVNLPYDAPPRLSGETKYNFLKMMAFAMSGLTSFSVRPLRLSFLMAALVALAAGLYGIVVTLCLVLGVPLVKGWTSTIFVMLMLGGAQLLAIGIASEYLARLFVEQKHRPVYLIKKQRTEIRAPKESE
ncbi:MAG TPA: glycosyltransferase family 2 protein [Candidatus Hydrogenedentes bacterium]|nr:glycosyltransferase family 2 protein [Candidatus Hydrogenedentota bacterium]